MPRPSFALPLAIAVVLAAASLADGATLYVASNGEDSLLHPCPPGSCTSKESPCRSISCAVRSAAPGDTIVVGPGRYGDLNGNGTLGEAGEEAPTPQCACMLAIDKPLTLVSSAGAAATIIDARSAAVEANVRINTSDATLGKARKGFTVTSTNISWPRSIGVAIDASSRIRIEGNQIVDGRRSLPSGPTWPPGYGIDMQLPSSDVVIQGNQVVEWTNQGILANGSNIIVRRNVMSLNYLGIDANGSTSVIGNIAVGNEIIGIGLNDSSFAIGNAALGSDAGIVAAFGMTGVATNNNLMGNQYGIENDGVAGLPATENYWGAATGPGPDPADEMRNLDANAAAIVTPFATKPFSIRVAIKP